MIIRDIKIEEGNWNTLIDNLTSQELLTVDQIMEKHNDILTDYQKQVLKEHKIQNKL